MDEEWWQSNLRDLEQESKCKETLAKMYTNINKQSTPPRHIIELLLHAPALYACAEEEYIEKEAVVNLAVDVIRSCLDHVKLDLHDPELPELFSMSLTHSNAAVRSHVLQILLKKFITQRNEKPLASSKLLFYVLDELQNDETRSSVIAIEILGIELPNWLTDAGIQSKLLQLLQMSEIVCCRVYELAVVVAKKSAASLSSVEFILDAALSELDNVDLLFMSSIMEILVPLAEQNHGLSYLERRRVLDIISARVEHIEDNPLDALILPSIMKFFGKIAAVQPHKIIDGYPQMVVCLIKLLESGDESMLPTALDTLANLNSTVQGKTLMQVHFKPEMEKLMRTYAEYVKRLSPPLKIRLLNSLDVIYTLETAPSTDLNSILLSWYKCFAGGANINPIMELVNTPFPDLQLAALGLLKTICKFDWGVKAVQDTAGAIEFLLSRQQELNNDVKYIKWKIMEVLSVSSIFTPTEIVRFTAYVNEGPFHLPSHVNIATEMGGNQ